MVPNSFIVSFLNSTKLEVHIYRAKVKNHQGPYRNSVVCCTIFFYWHNVWQLVKDSIVILQGSHIEALQLSFKTCTDFLVRLCHARRRPTPNRRMLMGVVSFRQGNYTAPAGDTAQWFENLLCKACDLGFQSHQWQCVRHSTVAPPLMWPPLLIGWSGHIRRVASYQENILFIY